ncbi:MAG: hypothetical protein M9899_03305 [Bdellovibrionaceae bacterium]|nr:hypothetical protein [Pseudobdellovibrionaceae bacterium]
MKVIFCLLMMFLSFEIQAARCEGFLGSSEGRFLSLTPEEGRKVLRTFGIMNPQLVSRFHENSKYQQIDHITNLNMSLQTLRINHNNRVLDKKIVQLLMQSQESVVTYFLSYKILNRQPIDPNTHSHIEKLAKVHLEIKARYAALDANPSASNSKELPRRSLLLLRFILDNAYLINQAETHFKLY